MCRGGKRFHQEQSALPCDRDYGFGFACIDRKRLFAQHVLAGLEADPHVLGMYDVRGGHVYHIHVRIGDEGFVRPVCARYVEFVGEGLCAVLGTRADGDEFG